MSHLWVLPLGTTETATQFSLEDCTWLHALTCYQSLFFAANNSKKLHKAAGASVKISCCTACGRTPGLRKHTEPEFEPQSAVFANPHCSSAAPGYTSFLDWAAKSIFCLSLQSMKFIQSIVCVGVMATWELDIEWPSPHRGGDGTSSHGWIG